jgi:hypothetical protein
MYLYSISPVNYRQRTIIQQEAGYIETYPVQPVRDVDVMERVHGLRYARIGILLVAGFLIFLAIVLVAALFSVL